jgi:hypothetical protein
MQTSANILIRWAHEITPGSPGNALQQVPPSRNTVCHACGALWSSHDLCLWAPLKLGARVLSSVLTACRISAGETNATAHRKSVKLEPSNNLRLQPRTRAQIRLRDTPHNIRTRATTHASAGAGRRRLPAGAAREQQALDRLWPRSRAAARLPWTGGGSHYH